MLRSWLGVTFLCITTVFASLTACGGTARRLKRAKAISHPVTTGRVDNVAVRGTDRGEYFFEAFSPDVMCFRIQHLNGSQTAADVSRHRYELVALTTAEQEFDTAPKLVSEPVQIVDARAHTHTGYRSVTDTVRDSTGAVIGTVERQVPYTYQLHDVTSRACFARPTEVVVPTTQFFVLRRTDARLPGSFGRRIQAMWRLEGGQIVAPPEEEE